MGLEDPALWQQLAVFQKGALSAPFGATGKLFWVMLRRLWVGWPRGPAAERSVLSFGLFFFPAPSNKNSSRIVSVDKNVAAIATQINE
jgi:hypothetical protein